MKIKLEYMGLVNEKRVAGCWRIFYVKIRLFYYYYYSRKKLYQVDETVAYESWVSFECVQVIYELI